jgi:hypothetical protein
MDRLVPFFELAQRFLFVAAPHAGGDDPRYAALCAYGITEVIAAIGAVGKHLAGIVGQRFGARFPLCLTQRASSSSSLAEAMMVASTSVPVLTVIALDLSCAVTVVNSSRSSLWATSSLRKRTNAVRSGVASVPENPQKRRKEARSSSASASFTSDRPYQIERSRALNIASGGQAGSPLVAE